MARLKVLLDVFTKVTTCVVLGVAVYCMIFFPELNFDTDIMWQILLVSFLTSAGTLMYTDDITKNSMKIRCVIHYFMVNVIVVVCGLWFEWFYADNLPQVIGMLVLIAIIYLFVSVVTWKSVMKEAELMNERLAEYQEKR
ncbi:MAG: DUF3021 family protein [Lachnospiraceae bacterium]|nr:DUF3021 family protein [Lachnospiraceae bacterium]